MDGRVWGAVDVDKLVQHYGPSVVRQVHKGYVYSDYNPYTITSRVTNKFGKINFAAVNKSDGSREAFISRHENGGPSCILILKRSMCA
jgi:hypothetical protein